MSIANALASRLSLLALYLGLGLATTANAALVTEWRFEATNDWEGTTFSAPGPKPSNNNFLVSDTLPDGSDPNGPSSSAYDIIQWGTPAAGTPSRSFLAMDDRHGGAGLFTGDPYGIAGTTVYHGNYRQLATGQKLLETTTATTNITLTPLSPEGEPLGPIQRKFFIKFTESLDTLDSENCPGGPWPPGTASCPDSFTVDLSEAFFAITLDDYIYTFSLLLLDVAGSENIARLTFENGQATVWTEENVRSKLVTRIVVTAERVPEPAPIALLGAGLAMLGLARRRRIRARADTN